MITVNNISKKYENKVVALQNINFKVKKGELVGVIGRNGAGKSTIFKILAGVITDYEGECLINDEYASLKFSKDISYLPEVRGLDGRQHVLEHLTDMLRYKGFRKKEAEAMILEWLDKFDLLDKKYKRIDTLSKGNQQKLQFILAIAFKPKLLILDEPFSGLDTMTTDIFWLYVEEIRNNGSTVIFSTHNLSDKINTCDRILFVKDGKIVENGSINDIKNKYPFIIKLKNSLFSPAMLSNFIDDSNIKSEEDYYLIKIKSIETAKKIYEKLNGSFSECFETRKMSLNELFREIELGKDTINDERW